MAPSAAFAEVLDACVGQYEPRGPAAAGRLQSGIATPSLFWFEGASLLTPRSAPSPKPQSARSPLRLVHSEREARPTRTLSPRQREALNQLIGLGAELDANFTLQELRSAFRALARAYHPDHHPGTRPGEKAHLSTLFVTLRNAYDALKTAA
jgi:hypothetical protein